MTSDSRRLVGWQLANNLGWFIELTLAMLSKFLAVVTFSAIFAVPGFVVLILGAWCGQIYMKAQLCVKVLGHFGTAIAGLSKSPSSIDFAVLACKLTRIPASIRAYGAQKQLRAELYHPTEKYVRAARFFYNLIRWVSICIEVLGAIFAACLAAYLVYGSKARAANTSFSLNMAGMCALSLSHWRGN